MAAAVKSRKRPGPDQDPIDGASAPGAGKKRPRYLFRNIEDYEKLEVLGEGSYGVVQKARDRRTGKKVALKRIRGEGEGGHGPPDRRVLTLEACLQTACRGHPSIVEIMDVAADAATGNMFLVMELVGPSLRETLWRPLSEDVTRVMMRQLVDAAKKMHDLGIIHRDLKLENVLVSPFGELKVCGFGAATRQKPAGTPYERHAGTWIYTSPEQLEDSRFYGPAVDMWALGCVMAELLTGAPLFQAETEADLFAEVSELRGRISSTGTTGTGTADVECVEKLSQAGREFLVGLLAYCPDERLTAAEALEHRWFTQKAESSASAVEEHPSFVSLFS